jgi:hypothetical protein
MRYLTLAIAIATGFACLSVVPAAQAQRVKYSCVQTAPGNFVCTPGPRRP